MTIAVGLIGWHKYSGGYAVIAADSQESYSSDMKGHTEKLRLDHAGVMIDGERTPAAIAITGAGGSRYLDYLKDEIAKLFWQHMRDGVLNDFGSVLRKYMVTFYRQHFLPFAVQPMNEYLEPELLVAAHVGEQRALWTAYRSTVRQYASGHASVGSGAIWADSVLERVDPQGSGFIHDEREATLAALYAVFAAKERSESCGQETLVASFRFADIENPSRGSYVAIANSEAVRQAEEFFRKYIALESDILRRVIESPGPIGLYHDDEPPPEAAEHSLARDIAEVREELAGIDFYWDQLGG